MAERHKVELWLTENSLAGVDEAKQDLGFETNGELATLAISVLLRLHKSRKEGKQVRIFDPEKGTAIELVFLPEERVGVT